MPWKNKEEESEKKRKYYQKNKTQIRARVKSWRESSLLYKEKNKRWSKEQKERRKVWINGLKSQFVCIICGENRVPCLDFHHRDPNEKDGKISHMLYHSKKSRVVEEIEKCDVLCANCHRIYHWEERNAGA